MISLPDWAFYPIAATLAAGMVAGALSLGSANQRTPEEILSAGLGYEGDALTGVVTGNGLTADFLTERGTPFLRVSATRGPLDGIQSAGAFFALSPAELEALEGHRVRIAVEARQAEEAPADGVRFAYFVPGLGQASWTRHELGGEYRAIEFDVSPPSCTWDYGYIGIWPDWTEEHNTVDIRSVRLTALEPLDC